MKYFEGQGNRRWDRSAMTWMDVSLAVMLWILWWRICFMVTLYVYRYLCLSGCNNQVFTSPLSGPAYMWLLQSLWPWSWRCDLRLTIKETSDVWGVAEDILNNQSRTADKWWSSSIVIGYKVKKKNLPINIWCYETFTKWSILAICLGTDRCGLHALLWWCKICQSVHLGCSEGDKRVTWDG
jgi:hypothetical protein